MCGRAVREEERVFSHRSFASRCFSYPLCPCSNAICLISHQLITYTGMAERQHSQGGSVTIASTQPPLLSGDLVTSYVKQSKKQSFTPYWSAARRIPGTTSLPFAALSAADVLEYGVDIPFPRI